MFLPEADREYLVYKGYGFQEIVEAGTNGLIICDWLLPEGKFNCPNADLLIFIPLGYPDIKPDMWHFFPQILLSQGTRPARAADTIQNFNGRIWQRWSRHLNPSDWRPGSDGIHTYLKKVDAALISAS
jgi:hypothetical protein